MFDSWAASRKRLRLADPPLLGSAPKFGSMADMSVNAENCT